MFTAKSISAEHKDLIHDVAFDFYGQRMATCSSDQSVQVWDLAEDGEWHCTASWKTHSGSVWRVTWAHPEYGQVLASCSFDRSAAVWEETIGDSKPNERGKHLWTQRAMLVDSRTSVSDVKFSPRHLGLQLATCSADGIVRIYVAPEVTNLARWELQEEIQTKLSCSCLSWNPSGVHSPLIAVGSDSPDPSGGGKVQIYECKEGESKWQKIETLNVITEAVHDLAFAPNLGRSYQMLAVATKDVRIMSLKPARREMREAAHLDFKQSQVWRVSWNVTGTILAASSDDGYVRLFKANYLDNWKCIQELKGSDSRPSPGFMSPLNPAHNQTHGGRGGSATQRQGDTSRNDQLQQQHQQQQFQQQQQLTVPGGRSSFSSFPIVHETDQVMKVSPGRGGVLAGMTSSASTGHLHPAGQSMSPGMARSFQESFLASPFKHLKGQSSALFYSKPPE